MRNVGLSILLVVAMGLLSRAASPRLNSISPPGAQRGTTVELKLYGTRLDAGPEIVFGDSGLHVSGIDSAKTNQIKALVIVATNCPLGEHQLRVRTAAGVSELRTFWVGAYTNISEIESNNSMAQAQRVPLGATINGTCGGEDVDVFRVEAKKGQRLSAEVEAIRLGRGMLDPALVLRDSERNILAAADDTSLLSQDAYVSILAPRDGTYYVELHDSTYSGNGLMDYRLHIGTFPRPAMVYPLGGKTGASVSFTFLDETNASATGGQQTITLPVTPMERFGLHAEQNGQIAPSPNWIRVSPFDNELEAEPNDRREAATPHYGDLPVAFNGVVSRKGDVDWFKFTGHKGIALDINVFARRLRSPLDSTIEILDSKGSSLASNDDGAGADSVARFTPAADGDYYIKIRDQFGGGGPDFVYRIEVTPQEPAIALNIPQVARNDSQSRQFIAVPRGNRFATMISARRANFSGDVVFEAIGLPAGVTLQGETLPGKLDQEPLVFEAAADAPVGGKYVDLVARPADATRKAASVYRHDIEFIPGPNNSYYYATHEPRLYVAVCEAAPFSIHIEEPKAPLVQYGALDLKIVAERRAGFDDPITVRMMWNPPGVSSLPDITIPKGSNSAIYQLNAKADAQPNQWKIAVLGSVGGERSGATFVSSALTPLAIAEPFVVGAIQPVMVSPGQQTNLVCKLDQKKAFEGKARVRVLGLPEGITVSEGEITSADKQIVLSLKVGDKVNAASYRNFLCVADVVHNGQTLPHNLASGAVIRVVPPKKDAPKQMALKK